MRLRHTLATVLFGFAATVAASAPASAAASAPAPAPACAFSATPGGTLVSSATLASPGTYDATIFYSGRPSCGTPFPYLVHSESTLHFALNGVAQPVAHDIKDCSSPDPIYCFPLSVSGVVGLKCSGTYSYDLWVSQTGWYQPAATAPKVTIPPVTGTHQTGTITRSKACG